MDLITFKHSFNSGDLITVLPGIKHICEKNNTKALIYQRLDLPADYGHNDNHPIKDASGRMVCMNRDMFDMMKPLIEAQEYVESFQIWEGQLVTFDYDLTRQNSQMPLPGGSIHKWPSLIFPQLECDLDIKWLQVEDAKRQQLASGHYDAGVWSFNNGKKMINGCAPIACQGNILINRTARYRNPYITYHFLQKYRNRLIFLGTDNEYESFCKEFGFGSEEFWYTIYHLSVADFYGLAQAIKNCKLFIGNQSLCWHIADAMKVPRVLEVCPQYPNTFPTGKNGYSFVTQGALEYFFDKLINKTDVGATQNNTGNS